MGPRIRKKKQQFRKIKGDTGEIEVIGEDTAWLKLQDTNLHHLNAGFDIIAVSVVQQMGQSDESMVQSFSWHDSPLL